MRTKDDSQITSASTPAKQHSRSQNCPQHSPHTMRTNDDSQITSTSTSAKQRSRSQSCPPSITAPREYLQTASGCELVYLATARLPSPLDGSAVFINNHFEIRLTTNKGYAAFARRDLDQGTHILMERPLFVSHGSSLFERYGNLDDKRKDIVLSLARGPPANDNLDPVRAVLNTNG